VASIERPKARRVSAAGGLYHLTPPPTMASVVCILLY